jgi:lysophospholipase L1-like esterase
VFGPKPDEGYVHEKLPDSTRFYRPKPGAIGTAGGEPFRINSLGMRDKEYALEKPPGVARIAILGDSFTFGSGVRESATFAKVLEASLNASGGGTRYEVMNFGVKGYDTAQELATLREVALPLDPDLIVVAYYLNDVGNPERFGGAPDGQPRDPDAAHVDAPRAEESGNGEDHGDNDDHDAEDADARIGGGRHEAQRPPLRMRVRSALVDNSHLAGFAIQQMAVVMRRFWKVPYQGSVDYNIPFVSDGAPWRASKRALGEMKAIADSLEVPMFLALIPEMGNFNELYPFRAAHDSIAAHCSRIGVPMCDLLDGFMGIEAKTLWVRWDDPHFNRRAHALAAQQIERALRDRGALARVRARSAISE